MKELMELINRGNKALDKVEAEREKLNETCEEIVRKYYKEPVARVYNNQQAYFYISNGVKPLEYYCDTVAKRIVFVFSKAQTSKLYGRWLNGENKQ